MRKLIIFAVLLFLGESVYAQEVNIVTRKNEGVFNTTEMGYLPGMGNISYDGELRANQSEAYRIRTMFGYFITPRFSVALGDLKAAAERRWNELDEIWEPLSSESRIVRVGAVMVHWREGSRYAEVVLSDGTRGALKRTRECASGQWGLRTCESRLICEAMATGSAEEM